MKKLLGLLLLLVIYFGYTKYERHKLNVCHWATHQMQFEFDQTVFGVTVSKEISLCSMTAIGPYAFITAAHCKVSSHLKIDGTEVSVIKSIYDGSEHTIYLISGKVFPYYVNVSQAPLKQGDKIFVYGFPYTHHDLLRQGYIMGIDNDEEHGNIVWIDANMFFGDSGAGLFNSQGELVTVGSAIEMDKYPGQSAEMKLVAAYDLHFRQSDYEEAYNFVP